MSDPRKIERADAIEVLWSLSGPYDSDRTVSAAAAIEQLTRYLAHAARPDVLQTLAGPNDTTVVLGHLRASIDSFGSVLGHLYSRAMRLADDPDLRHDRRSARAAATATDAAMALFTAMTALPPVVLQLGRAAERLGHLSLDPHDEGGR